MQKRNNIKAILALFLILIGINAAQVVAFSLNSALTPFSGLDIAGFYLRYYIFVDSLIYLIFFISLGQFAFGKVYQTSDKKPMRESKLIAIAIGLALTVGMITLESTTGFYLGKLYPVALIIFLLILAILLYNLLQGLFTEENGKAISLAITYLVIYGLLVVPFGVLNKWIEQTSPLLSGVLALASITSFIYLLIQLFTSFKNDDDPKTREDPNKKTDLEIDTRKKGSEEPKTKEPSLQATQTKNRNNVSIKSPKSDGKYPIGEHIPIIFEVKGDDFSKEFDYVIYLNERPYTNRVQNAKGPTIDSGKIELKTPGIHVLHIFTFKHNEEVLIENGSAECKFNITPNEKDATQDEIAINITTVIKEVERNYQNTLQNIQEYLRDTSKNSKMREHAPHYLNLIHALESGGIDKLFSETRDILSNNKTHNSVKATCISIINKILEHNFYKYIILHIIEGNNPNDYKTILNAYIEQSKKLEQMKSELTKEAQKNATKVTDIFKHAVSMMRV